MIDHDYKVAMAALAGYRIERETSWDKKENGVFPVRLIDPTGRYLMRFAHSDSAWEHAWEMLTRDRVHMGLY